VNLLGDEDRAQLVEAFAALERDVPITVVTHESSLIVPGQQLAVPYGAEVKQIVLEVASLSPRIKAEVIDVPPSDTARLKELGVARLPAILLGAVPSVRARYYGLPAGHEFATLISAILDLGTAESALSEATTSALAALKNDVHIQVFVTPT
jgi:alkyl hydroperoxide reductase subunit AhpF